LNLFRKYTAIILTSISTLLFVSCEKQLEVDQDSLFLVDEAIKTPSDLQAFLVSIYDMAANVNNGTYQLFADLPSDDLAKPYNDAGTFRTEAYERSTTIFNSDLIGVYSQFYGIVYRVNLLEGLYA